MRHGSCRTVCGRAHAAWNLPDSERTGRMAHVLVPMQAGQMILTGRMYAGARSKNLQDSARMAVHGLLAARICERTHAVLFSQQHG